jgi:hypothetical protein
LIFLEVSLRELGSYRRREKTRESAPGGNGTRDLALTGALPSKLTRLGEIFFFKPPEKGLSKGCQSKGMEIQSVPNFFHSSVKNIKERPTQILNKN